MSKYNLFRLISRYISPDTFKRILNFLKYYFGGLFRRIDQHHIFLYGGGIAFSLILSLIPFILLVFGILGNIIDPGVIEQLITNAIDTIIPYPQYADYTKKAILDRVPEVIEYKTAAAWLGGFGLFFTSTWLFSSMRTVLNNIYGISDRRGAIHGIIRDFAMVLLFIIFILVSTFILPFFNLLGNIASRNEWLELLNLEIFLDWAFSLISFFVILLSFFVFYKLIPYAKLGKKVPFVSAFWAAILWEIARTLFGFYVKNFLSTNKIYGAFILFAVILFWLFYASCLFIIGAEIGQLFRERRAARMNDNNSA
jgi:membrane protein